LIAYLDASALVKLFLDEVGSTPARAIWGTIERAVSARVTYVEVRAGLSAARRSGRLSATSHDSALAGLGLLWPELDVVDLTQDRAERAADLADAYGLRAGDSIQLASALDVDGATMVAFDMRLRTAAAAAGLAVYPETV
jgi:predicted nucleic acid-binding protein